MANVIIVSNRLPISVKKVNGKLEFTESVGGLSKGLASYAKRGRGTWIGWPGIVSDELDEDDKRLITERLAKQHYHPVFLTQKQLDDYYSGYSNNILWPFFHDLETDFTGHDKQWRAYQNVNRLFAEVASLLSTPDSTVWVHDYQLMLVPELLRKEGFRSNIGFFLHIPFPKAAAFSDLPHAESLLKGVLGSDLIGLHTTDYVDNFLDTCTDLRVGMSGKGQVILPDRAVRVTDFPIGIDYTKYAEASALSEVQKHVRHFKRQFGKYKVILTVDRLDPTKGLVERLEAYREFLQRKPKLHEQVVMIMQAAPSRTDIEAYRRLKDNVDKLVREINKTFGKPGWKPVHYRYTAAPFEEVAALYQIADVAFIAPLKDGMNLVAKEYVASKSGGGVLILSETAGAAQELSDAILVNPTKRTMLVNALSRAVAMPPAELRERLRNMQASIAGNTIQAWAGSFMTTLRQPVRETKIRTRALTDPIRQKLADDYHSAHKRLLLLDYDGVLAPFVPRPEDAKPSPELIKLLRRLARQNETNVVIISGRSRSNLEAWLGRLPIGLAAEHGALLRKTHSDWQIVTAPPTDWKEIIRPVLEKYATRTPGAFVEEKECSLVWHYRKSPPFHAQKNIVVLKKALKPYLAMHGLALHSGNMILEIKSPDANKGKAATHWLEDSPDFILAIGDDFTDEDMFAALPPSAHSMKVGPGQTNARYRLKSTREVFDLLQKFSA